MEYNDIYRIATLIVKSIKKDLSEEECRELDNWRNGSERNRQLYQKYQHAGFFRERSLLDESDSSERIRKGVRMAIAKKRRRALWIKTVSFVYLWELSSFFNPIITRDSRMVISLL